MIDPTSLLRIGEWTLDSVKRKLTKGPLEKQIRAQAAQVLVCLADKPNQMVSREEIIDLVWSGNYQTGDRGINNAISELRKLFGDDPNAPQMIETIPRKGYRLLQPVSIVTDASVEIEPAVQTPQLLAESTPTPEPIPEKPMATKPMILAAALLSLILLIIIFLTVESPSSKQSQQASYSAPTSLTFLPGIEHFANISPNGELLAFVWTQGNNKSGLYIKSLNQPSSEPLILTENSGRTFAPFWLPDSRSLIYARQEKGTLCSIHQISIEMKQNKLITECWADASSGHALSRDGQWLVYTVTNINPGDNGGIQLLNLKTLTKKTLVTYQPTDFGDYDFSWSPDNSLIAMTRINTPSTREIVTLSLDGAIEQITRDSAIIAGHTWSADGQSIVYSSKKGGAPRLWQANIADHSSTLLGLSVAASHPYMTQDGKTLLYQKNFQVIDIQQIVLNNPVDGTVSTNSTSTINNVISSTGIDTAPDYSDMTEQLVFSSNRSGYQEIWLANFDGSNPVQLSQFESTAYHPKWSPDGKKIAFTVSDASQSKQQQVFILNLLTRQYSQITYEPVDHLYPEWSADGESIYTSMRTANRWNIWQYPLSKEAPRQITHAGGLISYPAPTGDGIYFSKNESDGIWYQPDNSDEQWVFSTANKDIHNKWVIDANGIFYVTTRDKHQQLEYYDFATKTIAVKTKLKKSAIIQSSLTYNAKLSTFYYSHSGRKESDIIMTSVAQ